MSWPFTKGRNSPGKGVRRQTMRNERQRFSRVAGTPSLYLLLVSALLLIAPERATAFEADVHYGLTDWLALQAGFEPLQAQIIATGDERVDFGRHALHRRRRHVCLPA